MTNLYVIGNGFDRHHGLRTAYGDYRDYLERLALCGNIRSKYSEKDEFWTDIEKGLRIDYKHFLENYIKAYNFENPTPGQNAIQDIQLVNRLQKEDKYFEELAEFTGNNFYYWLMDAYTNGIQKAAKSALLRDITDDDSFVSFNYTLTLEEVYKIKPERVFHIHGQLDRVDDSEICVHHILDNDNLVLESRHSVVHAELQFGNPDNSSDTFIELVNSVGVTPNNPQFDIKRLSDRMTSYLNCTQKKLECNAKQLKRFTEPLVNDTKNVVVLGHSFYGIDYPYYKGILVPLFNKKTWIFYCYSDEDKENAERFAEENGLDFTIKEW